MRTYPTVIAVIVLSVAALAGVAFSGGCSSSANLIWTHPTAAATPAAHTYINCAVSGANTATLKISASTLSTGDGCTYTADLANTGNVELRIAPTVATSTPHGDPAFGSCFGYSLSAGPPQGKLQGGSSYPYTFTIGVLGNATNVCEGVTGSIVVTFTGTSGCSSPAPPNGWKKLGPNVDLQGQNLSGLNLAGYDLAGDNLAGADLSCDNLNGANLKGANLQNANLMYCNLTGAFLQGSNGEGGQDDFTVLTGANFQGANLQNANLDGSLLTGLSVEPTDFNGANLQGLNLGNVSATGYITAVGANTNGVVNLASCVATSGLSAYCDEL